MNFLNPHGASTLALEKPLGSLPLHRSPGNKPVQSLSFANLAAAHRSPSSQSYSISSTFVKRLVWVITTVPAGFLLRKPQIHNLDSSNYPWYNAGKGFYIVSLSSALAQILTWFEYALPKGVMSCNQGVISVAKH
jgi:hypothetical protein